MPAVRASTSVSCAALSLSSPPIVFACASRGIPFRGPGGASVHLRAMARALGQQGYAVDAWMRRIEPGGGPSVATPAGVELHEAPRGRLPGVLRRDPRKDLRVDARAMAQALRRRPAALLYERWSLLAQLGPAPGAPYVLEVNAPLAWEAALFEGVRPGRDLVAWEERSLQAADRVVVVSEALADYVVGRGVDRARVLVEPNGVDGGSLAARAADGEAGGPRVLGYAGTFKPWQGLRGSAESLARLRADGPLCLQLWGDGPDKRALLAAAGQAGVEVDDRGWGTSSQIAAARAAWWAAWVPLTPWPGGRDLRRLEALFGSAPSRWYSPLKEAEAAAAGVPVWRGAGPPVELPPPSQWTDIAARVLESVGLPAHRASGLAPRDPRGTIQPGLDPLQPE